MNEKERRIESVLASESYIKKVDPSDQLMKRLYAIPFNIQKIKKVPIRVVWSFAAGIALLIALNIFSVRNSTVLNKQNGLQETQLSDTYFSYLKQL